MSIGSSEVDVLPLGIAAEPSVDYFLDYFFSFQVTYFSSRRGFS